MRLPVLTRRFAIFFRGRRVFLLEIRKHEHVGEGGDKVKEQLVSISHLFTAIFKVVHYWLHLYFSFQRGSQKTLLIKNYFKLTQTVFNSILFLFTPPRPQHTNTLLPFSSECGPYLAGNGQRKLAGQEGGRWCSALASTSRVWVWV